MALDDMRKKAEAMKKKAMEKTADALNKAKQVAADIDTDAIKDKSDHLLDEAKQKMGDAAKNAKEAAEKLNMDTVNEKWSGINKSKIVWGSLTIFLLTLGVGFILDSMDDSQNTSSGQAVIQHDSNGNYSTAEIAVAKLILAKEGTLADVSKFYNFKCSKGDKIVYRFDNSEEINKAMSKLYKAANDPGYISFSNLIIHNKFLNKHFQYFIVDFNKFHKKFQLAYSQKKYDDMLKIINDLLSSYVGIDLSTSHSNQYNWDYKKLDNEQLQNLETFKNFFSLLRTANKSLYKPYKIISRCEVIDKPTLKMDGVAYRFDSNNINTLNYYFTYDELIKELSYRLVKHQEQDMLKLSYSSKLNTISPDTIDPTNPMYSDTKIPLDDYAKSALKAMQEEKSYNSSLIHNYISNIKASNINAIKTQEDMFIYLNASTANDLMLHPPLDSTDTNQYFMWSCSLQMKSGANYICWSTTRNIFADSINASIANSLGLGSYQSTYDSSGFLFTDIKKSYVPLQTGKTYTVFGRISGTSQITLTNGEVKPVVVLSSSFIFSGE